MSKLSFSWVLQNQSFQVIISRFRKILFSASKTALNRFLKVLFFEDRITLESYSEWKRKVIEIVAETSIRKKIKTARRSVEKY